MKTCIVWILQSKWQCATIYHVIGCLIASYVTPLFVLLGASVKSRYLWKPSHPLLLSRQVQMVIFISKITFTTKSSSRCIAPMRSHNTLHCPKEEQNYCYLARRILTVKQVTMHRNLSCYSVFHYLLTPPCVLLGASAKCRCLKKASQPSLLSSQAYILLLR